MSAAAHAATAKTLFLSRQAEARRQVAAGQVDPGRATQALRPWAAIACLAGADLPELTDGLAEPWFETVFPSDEPPLQRALAAHAMRALLAEELCPRIRWAPLLAQARDRALDKAAAAEAAALQALCRALHVELPYLPRPAPETGGPAAGGMATPPPPLLREAGSSGGDIAPLPQEPRSTNQRISA